MQALQVKRIPVTVPTRGWIGLLMNLSLESQPGGVLVRHTRKREDPGREIFIASGQGPVFL